jgi:hypothetical protein
MHSNYIDILYNSRIYNMVIIINYNYQNSVTLLDRVDHFLDKQDHLLRQSKFDHTLRLGRSFF